MPSNVTGVSGIKKTLFISYNFPPHGGAGVQRSAKFVKYLPEFGWRPLVVAGAADAALVSDPSMMADIPAEAQVHRVPGFSIGRLQKRARAFGLGKAVVALNVLLQLPDPARLWNVKARKAVRRIVADHKPDLIYTTSGPYSSHLLGQWAKRTFNLPWLADFRDPWSENLLVPYLPGYRRLNRRMERDVLVTADRVVCVSSGWLEGLRSNCHQCSPDKFSIIANGYDDQDVSPLPLRQRGDQFTITHIGSFYRTRRPDGVVAALDLLIRSGRISSEALSIRFVGKNASSSVPDRPPYVVQGYVPHTELVNVRSESDALLLILSTAPENVGTPSGKIYEYIASNRPILAIVPKNGVAQKLIEETRTGIAIGGDANEIADAIERMYRQWQAGFPDWDPNWEAIRQYTRRNLTSKLAAVFDEMVAETGL